MASKGGLEEVPEGMLYFIFVCDIFTPCAGFAPRFSGDDITQCAL
jgi:hypothetical protein